MQSLIWKSGDVQITLKTKMKIKEKIWFQSLLIDLSILGGSRSNNNESHLLISAANSLSMLERLVQRWEAVYETVDKTSCIWQLFGRFHSQESSFHVVKTIPRTGDQLLVELLSSS